jgi:hypothetical protein
VKAGTSPSSSNSPDPAYIAFSAFPDLHFMGLAGDCGIVLGNSPLSAVVALSVVRSREVVQVKLVEAINRAASREAARASKASQQAVQEGTPVWGWPLRFNRRQSAWRERLVILKPLRWHRSPRRESRRAQR